MSGKGSKPRPFSVSADEYANRYEAIFGKKQVGSGVTGSATDSNSVGPSSALGSPAIYIDNETGA